MFTKINESVRYIGTDDITLDLFESQYPVPSGMSYNSYLVIDAKVAVLDTADARKGGEWLANLEEALEGRTPDYLVVHHLELDHSSMIASALDKYPSMTVVCTQVAAKMLPQFFGDMDFEGRCMTVGEGDVLELGAHRLQFFMAPMVHWPEVMVSYESSEKLLFSADAFGTFGSVGSFGGLFCGDLSPWTDEARRYYFNICGKYGMQVGRLLDKLTSLEVSAVCPLHGPVLSDVGFRTWRAQSPSTGSGAATPLKPKACWWRMLQSTEVQPPSRSVSLKFSETGECGSNSSTSAAAICHRRFRMLSATAASPLRHRHTTPGSSLPCTISSGICRSRAGRAGRRQ